MRGVGVFAAVLAISVGVASAAGAATTTTKKKHQPAAEPVERTAAGTVIQPTRTIIHNPNGTTTVIVIPRHRSYLDTGTEVSPGDRGFMDYALPPAGDPGHQNWFYGPDQTGSAGYPLPRAFDIPGYNPDTPF